MYEENDQRPLDHDNGSKKFLYLTSFTPPSVDTCSVSDTKKIENEGKKGEEKLCTAVARA